MIAVTCRNGEHFTVDPMHIERIETSPDTVIHLVDGTKYVAQVPFDELMLAIRDHRAAVVVAQKRLAGGVAEFADHAAKVARASVRIERRQYRRDDEHPGDPRDRAADPIPGDDED